MTDFAAYFLASQSSVVLLETLEISHPSFSKVYWIVRNAIGGITAELEDGGGSQDFDYYPLRIRPIGSNDDLDQTLEVDLGDLGELIPAELDRVAAAGTGGTKPAVKYRSYRSDDLSAPLDGPLVLELQDLSSDRQGSTFQAKAPSLNITRTGELYRIDRFPMLRGLL